jgi:hypothetical protein
MNEAAHSLLTESDRIPTCSHAGALFLWMFASGAPHERAFTCRTLRNAFARPSVLL